MEMAVYDTRLVKKDGQMMHFDIIVPKDQTHEAVLRFGREYLEKIGQAGQPLTAKECEFCHVEEATPEIEQAIRQAGYFIYELEGCP